MCVTLFNMSIRNMWEFPGGKVEKGEDIFTALKREIDEELQCKVETKTSIFNDNTMNMKPLLLTYC